MLNFEEFFDACAGIWKIERTYHYMDDGEIERSHTEYDVKALTDLEKQVMLKPTEELEVQPGGKFPGFAIAFNTVSETGEQVSMNLKALFVPDTQVIRHNSPNLPDPIAAELPANLEETIRGFYLRDEGYSEAGAIAGRFTYLPSRQTLEMTTYYRRSVAVDQMRFLDPKTRLRTIVTYQRPESAQEVPSAIILVGFGVERKE